MNVDKLYKATGYKCETEGDQVVLTIGNTWYKMDYKVALSIATLMTVCGRKAKRNAGDTSRIYNHVFDLTSGEKEALEHTINKDRVNLFNMPEDEREVARAVNRVFRPERA